MVQQCHDITLSFVLFVDQIEEKVERLQEKVESIEEKLDKLDKKLDKTIGELDTIYIIEWLARACIQ